MQKEKELEIRSDLWSEMSSAELQNQLDLITSKLSLLASMLTKDNTNQSIYQMYEMLQNAYDTVSNLISNRVI